MGRLPLQGIRVLDLTQIWAGPRAIKLLADMGAETIKVEYWARMEPGSVRPEQSAERPGRRGGSFEQLHRNKYSITVDLKHPAGAQLFHDLVGVSDVVADNFSRGVLDRLGLGYAQLSAINPALIMLSMPIVGQTGPERDYIGFGVTMEQISGQLSLTGYPGGMPMKSGTNHGDPTNGVHAAAALMTALLYRARTGKGQFIDYSHLESAVPLIGEAILDYTMNGRVGEPQGNRDAFMAPHGCYRCQGEDQWVAIAVEDEAQWRALCRCIGQPDLADDPRFADHLSRYRHQDALTPLIEAWTTQYDHYQAMHRLQAAGVPAGAVLDTLEVFQDPHLQARGYFETLEHPDIGSYRYMGIVPKLSKTPGHIRFPAPRLGQHNHAVFGNVLGLSLEEIQHLEEQGVIGPPADLL
ncbi:MAG: CoA transferase [Chloroflexi bacterium]|nr:CoA transferase [Chloroflexota bacterium]